MVFDSGRIWIQRAKGRLGAMAALSPALSADAAPFRPSALVLQPLAGPRRASSFYGSSRGALYPDSAKIKNQIRSTLSILHTATSEIQTRPCNAPERQFRLSWM